MRQAPAGGAAAAQPAAEGRTGAFPGERAPGPRKQGRAAQEPVRAADAEAAPPARAAGSSGANRHRAGKAAAGGAALAQRTRALAGAADQAHAHKAPGGGGGAGGMEEDAQGDAALVRRSHTQGGVREGPADEGASGSDEEASACPPGKTCCLLNHFFEGVIGTECDYVLDTRSAEDRADHRGLSCAWQDKGMERRHACVV